MAVRLIWRVLCGWSITWQSRRRNYRFVWFALRSSLFSKGQRVWAPLTHGSCRGSYRSYRSGAYVSGVGVKGSGFRIDKLNDNCAKLSSKLSVVGLTTVDNFARVSSGGSVDLVGFVGLVDSIA